MSEPISFVASDDLAEWLRAEADRRALTVPATVQQLLVEVYRERDSSPSRVAPESTEQRDDDGGGETSDDLAALADEVANQGVERDALDRHPEAWTMEERAGERYYAVELRDGERRFHATRSGAAETITDAYE